MAKLVAKTYSEALFEVAIEQDQLDLIHAELGAVSDIFEENADFFEVFRTPKINKEERKAIIEEVFSKTVSQEVMNFLKILIDKKRGSAIHGIRREFDRMVNEHKGIVKAIVESAVELTETEQERLKAELARTTGKTILLSNKINPEVVGGLVIRIGDKVIDGSVRSRLATLKDSLAQIIV